MLHKWAQLMKLYNQGYANFLEKRLCIVVQEFHPWIGMLIAFQVWAGPRSKWLPNLIAPIFECVTLVELSLLLV